MTGSTLVLDGGQPVCPAHGREAVVETCERCGDFLCPLCTGLTDGRLYCPECAGLVAERAQLVDSRRLRKAVGLLFATSFASCIPILGQAYGWVVVGAFLLLLLDRRLSGTERRIVTAGICVAVGGMLLTSLFMSWAMGGFR